MADNYLEKRYAELFRNGTRIDPETGYQEFVSRRRRRPEKIND